MDDELVPWVLCECEDYWCLIQGQHVYECPCPDIDWWAARNVSPYEPVSKEAIKCLRDETEGEPEETSGILRQSDGERCR